MADLICALCIRSPEDVVLDPSCGTGDLLERAGARLRWLGGGGLDQLRGVEIDAALAGAARARLPGASIVTADFLAPAFIEAPGASGRVERDDARLTSERVARASAADVVVGNPPYVRQELLDRSFKRRLAVAGWAAGSLRADLHTYFWDGALRCLKPGGRLGFLTSASWLDARYGDALRERLAAEHRIIALIESGFESWFDAARVRTVIAIIEKRPPRDAEVRLVRLARRLVDIVPDGLGETERLDRFDRLARDIESGSGSLYGVGSSSRAVEQTTLRGRRWGGLLRSPALTREILARVGERLVPLGDVATIRWGIKTGDDHVFYPGRETAACIERRFLVPVVFNLMELSRPVVTTDQLRRRLLLIDQRRHSIQGTGAGRYFHRMERERASHLRPTCRARERRRRGAADARRWFELRPGPPGRILWSIMQQYRHLAPQNPSGFLANDNLLLIDAAPGIDPVLLAALLNSHLQALLKLDCGRHRNEGMLKMQASDLRQMQVPDPRRITGAAAARIVAAFDALARRRVGKIDEECGRPGRRRLDRAVLAALGMGPEESEPLLDRLYATLIERQRSERGWEQDAVARRRLTRAARRPATARAGRDPGSPR